MFTTAPLVMAGAIVGCARAKVVIVCVGLDWSVATATFIVCAQAMIAMFVLTTAIFVVLSFGGRWRRCFHVRRRGEEVQDRVSKVIPGGTCLSWQDPIFPWTVVIGGLHQPDDRRDTRAQLTIFLLRRWVHKTLEGAIIQDQAPDVLQQRKQCAASLRILHVGSRAVLRPEQDTQSCHAFFQRGRG